jgi:hypothetical protein
LPIIREAQTACLVARVSVSYNVVGGVLAAQGKLEKALKA